MKFLIKFPNLQHFSESQYLRNLEDLKPSYCVLTCKLELIGKIRSYINGKTKGKANSTWIIASMLAPDWVSSDRT